MTTDSITEAMRALQEDKDGCGKQGGYSDCKISLTDGGDIMDDEEYQAAEERAYQLRYED